MEEIPEKKFVVQRKYIKKSPFQKKKQAAEEKRQAKKALGAIIHQEKDFICPICLQFICYSSSLKCGHAFCEQCLCEYELLFEECLVCGKSITGQEFRSCFLLDNLIEEFIKEHIPTEKESYESRKAETILKRQAKQIPKIEVGELVDVRNGMNVWCPGIISRVQPSKQQTPHSIIISYLNGRNQQEELQVGSNRLSAKGTYTSRKDIPHYDSFGKNSELVICRPNKDGEQVKLYLK